MKKTLFLLTTALLGASVFAFDPAPSIKPAVKTGEYTKTDYQITEKFGDYYRSPRAKFVHVFDANGRETEICELTSKDVLVDKTVYTYEGNNVVAITSTDADGKLAWKMTTAYDANGNKTEESEFNASNNLVNKTIWRINGKQIDESYYNADGALLSKIITKYDDQNRVTEVAQYAAAGFLEEKSIYAYNDAGKLSEISYFNAKDILTRKVVYRFDASYQITEEQTYNADNKLSVRIIYKYDESGNIIKMTKYNVAEKFGTTVNELTGITEYAYGTTNAPSSRPSTASVPGAPRSTPTTTTTNSAVRPAVIDAK
jgi:antitoxin component YwqK of YwqJK toxin-antitoxin module